MCLNLITGSKISANTCRVNGIYSSLLFSSHFGGYISFVYLQLICFNSPHFSEPFHTPDLLSKGKELHRDEEIKEVMGKEYWGERQNFDKKNCDK